MELKQGNPKSRIRLAATNVFRYGGVRVLALFLYTMLVLTMGAAIEKGGYPIGPIEALRSVWFGMNALPKVLRARFASPEQIYIDIKHKHYMKLMEKRQQALAAGILISSEDDYVPASIRHKDRRVDVKVRLKGDLKDHWETNKWSLRIKVKGDNTLFGMKRFSIQNPRTRAYIYEWLYQRALRMEGIIGLRYNFIDVTLNGKHLGIFALEEHFDKRLIENNRFREGPIVRLNEEVFWKELAGQRHVRVWDRKQVTGAGSYLVSEISAYQANRWVSDPTGVRQYSKAIHLIDLFRSRKLKTSEVFDVKKLATFFALNDVMGASHASMNWINARFYYNPITARLEPIGYDGYDQIVVPLVTLTPVLAKEYRPSISDEIENPYQYVSDIFSDMTFYEEYVKQLCRLSEPGYLDHLFENLKDELQSSLNILYRDFPTWSFSKDIFYRNQEYVRVALNPPKTIKAIYHEMSNRKVSIQVGNVQFLPVKVLSMSYKDTIDLQPTRDIVLEGRKAGHQLEFKPATFPVPMDMTLKDSMMTEVKVKYTILGTGRVRSQPVATSRQLIDQDIGDDPTRMHAKIAQLDFVTVDELKKIIKIKRGRWNINANVIIPSGYRVIGQSGTTLNLIHSAKIISYSPITFRGSKEKPIVIESTDDTGQGLGIINAKGQSELRYVSFVHLSNPSHHGLELTGAVTFYQSPVTITHTSFTRIRAEDALNVVRADFVITNALFENSLSDAIDLDFAKGTISDSVFVESGNDAIDASGSKVDIGRIFIKGAGDKGLSAGEDSHLSLHDVEVSFAKVAVAAKDSSNVEINGIHIKDSEIGFAAYQKKPEFGSALMKVTGAVLTDVTSPHLVEARSSLIIDGRVIDGVIEHVRDVVERMRDDNHGG